MIKNTSLLLSCIASFLLFNHLPAQTGFLTELSSISNLSPTFGIALKGDYLYANLGFSRIEVINIANPSSPSVLSPVAYPGQFAEKIDNHGDFLYLMGGPANTFRIFEIINPLQPTARGTLSIPMGGLQNFTHTDHYSYISDGAQILVLNTSDKSNPVIQDTIIAPNSGNNGIYDLETYQNALYASFNAGVHVFDISNPAQPTWVQTLTNGSYVMTLDTVASRLIVARDFGSPGHFVFDISSPLAPALEFSGSGGTSVPFHIAYINGVVLQTGPDVAYMQTVNAYSITSSASTFEEDFQGSMGFAVTDIVARDSVFYVSKHGGIELLGFPLTVGLDEQLAESQLEIFPNPATELVHIRIRSGIGLRELYVRDLQGKMLREMQISAEKTELDLREFAPGAYFITVRDEEEGLHTRMLTVH